MTVAASPSNDENELARLLKLYPTAQGYEVRKEKLHSWDADERLVLWWPAPEQELGRRWLTDIGLKWRDLYFVRPPLGAGNTATPSPLMTWWTLLLGLSIAARYGPAAWTAALDPDRSPMATALEEALELADQRIAELVVDGVWALGHRRARDRLEAGEPLVDPPSLAPAEGSSKGHTDGQEPTDDSGGRGPGESSG